MSTGGKTVDLPINSTTIYSISQQGELAEIGNQASQEDHNNTIAIIATLVGLGKSWEDRTVIPHEGFSISRSLYHAHNKNQVSLVDPFPDGDQQQQFQLLARWTAVKRQDQVMMAIEQRLRDGLPHDVESIGNRDPRALKIDHTQFERLARPFRPFDALGIVVNSGELDNAATEGISCEYVVGDDVENDPLKVIIVFDPTPFYKSISITYDFWSNGSPTTAPAHHVPSFLRSNPDTRTRFIDKLTTRLVAHPGRQHIRRHIIGSISEIVSDDEGNWLRQLTRNLGVIERTVADRTKLKEAMPDWTNLLATSRQRLLHQRISLTHLISRLDHYNEPSQPSSSRSNSLFVDTTKAKLQLILDEGKQLLGRVEGTFQVLMSIMSIIESERAIEEAEGISKLTHLAFFFIPITFVASLGGMNITDWTDQIRYWHWMVASAGASVLTYAVLYWSVILHTAALIPVQSLHLNRARIMALVKITTAAATSWSIIFIACTGLYAGLGIAIFKVNTSSLLTPLRIVLFLLIAILFLLPGVFILLYIVRKSRLARKNEQQSGIPVQGVAQAGFGLGNNGDPDDDDVDLRVTRFVRGSRVPTFAEQAYLPRHLRIENKVLSQVRGLKESILDR